MILYADLDRLFFERLRLVLVERGLLPDVLLYTTEAEFIQARKSLAITLKAQGLDIIDVFGVGSGDERGLIKGNRITIGRGKQERGSLAVGPEPYKVKNFDGTYNVMQHLDFAKDISYEIRMFSQSTQWERYLMDLLDEAFGQRRFFHPIDPNAQETQEIVLVEWMGGSDIAIVADIRENLYSYAVRDAWVGAGKLLQQRVPPMTTVDFFVYSNSTQAAMTPPQTID